jgi:hypothetical protein
MNEEYTPRIIDIMRSINHPTNKEYTPRSVRTLRSINHSMSENTPTSTHPFFLILGQQVLV